MDTQHSQVVINVLMTYTPSYETRLIGNILTPRLCTGAWGVAIHQKSRLIAVTSNHKHVTIFAHSYSDTSKEATFDDENLDEFVADWDFPTMNSIVPMPTSFRVRDRRHNYRIVLAFGTYAANMPSIDFVSDSEGEAGEIITTDINGTAVSYTYPYSSIVILYNTVCYMIIEFLDHIFDRRDGWYRSSIVAKWHLSRSLRTSFPV